MEKIKTILLSGLFMLAAANIFAASKATDSQYRRAGNFIFISAQAPINPSTNQLVSTDSNQQVKQVFDNLRDQVLASGASMKDVVKINVYMTDIDKLFPIVKQYIPHYFVAPYPARTPLGGISFGKSSGFMVAIDAVVYRR